MIYRSFLLMVLVCVAGCSSGALATYPVTGVVTLDGKPLKQGFILVDMIGPASDGKHYSARGLIDAEGKYQLTTFSDNDGAIPGRYRVQVTSPTGPLSDDPNSQQKAWFPNIGRTRLFEEPGLYQIR